MRGKDGSSPKPAASWLHVQGWPDCGALTLAFPTIPHPTPIPTISPWQLPFSEPSAQAIPGYRISPAWPLLYFSAGGGGGGGRLACGAGRPGAEALQRLSQKTSHVQPRAPAPALAAGGPTTAALLAATARHPGGQGHHHGLHPLCAEQSHVLPEEEAA